MILITICLALALTFAKEHPEAKLQFYEYCQHFNYPIQKHQVITEDGYILGVFRIQKKATTIRGGLKPILLLHGLMDSSDTFIVNEESKAPAFVLANAEYDVWLGNSRGNKHSRRHVSLNPDKGKQFWMLTFEEMGNMGMPAIFPLHLQLQSAEDALSGPQSRHQHHARFPQPEERSCGGVAGPVSCFWSLVIQQLPRIQVDGAHTELEDPGVVQEAGSARVPAESRLVRD